MTNSLGLLVGATGPAQMLLMEYSGGAHVANLATYNSFFPWGSLPADHTYRFRMEVTGNASAVSVYAAYGEGSETWTAIPTMQNISLVGTSVEGTTGYMSVATFDMDGELGRKQFDNVSYVPEPATMSLLAIGSLVGLVRRRRS